MPEVTVVIPAHNAGRTIDAALESVFAQTFKDVEVIVVDDGSTDDTASRVAAFGPRVTYCRETGSSIVRALNAGLLLGSSRVVALLEPTSTWMPRKLDRQLRYLEAHPRTALLYARALTSDAPATALPASADAAPISEPSEPPTAPGAIMKAASIPASTVVFKREAVYSVGAFDPSVGLEESVRDFATRVAVVAGIGYQNIPVALDGRIAPAPAAPAPAKPRQTNLLHDTGYRREGDRQGAVRRGLARGRNVVREAAREPVPARKGQAARREQGARDPWRQGHRHRR